MDKNEELLQFLHESASMSVDAATKLLEKTEDDKLKREISGQISAYRKFAGIAAERLGEHGLTPRGVKMMTKLMADIGIVTNTAIDSTSSHIAEIMINGTNMGIVKMQKQLNSSFGCADSTRELCSGMVNYQRKCSESLEAYLR